MLKEQLPTEDLEVQEDRTYIEKPTQILETADSHSKKHHQNVVKWGHHSEEEAT
jgi:phosphohistidine phosphatase SixA